MKVLIAYDGAHPIDYFIQDLKRAGLPNKLEARVLTVVDAYMPPAKNEAVPESSLSSIEMMRREITARIKKELERAKKEAGQTAEKLQASFREWSVKGEACEGSPSAAILQKADEWKPDLIVLGAHGNSAVARFFLGSVSSSVLIHSKYPVRIVRKRAKKKEYVRLIIGMDGSLDSQKAVQTVCGRVWPKGTSVWLVTGFDQNMVYAVAFHHLPASKSAPKGKSEELLIRQMTAPYAEKLKNAGLRVTEIIKAGKPWKVLADEAEKWKADCIFIGARGLSRLDRFLLGSVSNTVASRAHCSVEVVRFPK